MPQDSLIVAKIDHMYNNNEKNLEIAPHLHEVVTKRIVKGSDENDLKYIKVPVALSTEQKYALNFGVQKRKSLRAKFNIQPSQV